MCIRDSMHSGRIRAAISRGRAASTPKNWAGLKEISPAAAVKRQRKSGIVRSRQSTAEAAVSAVRNKSACTGHQPL